MSRTLFLFSYWRRGRDSNPGKVALHWFSRPALSTAQPPLRRDGARRRRHRAMATRIVAHGLEPSKCGCRSAAKVVVGFGDTRVPRPTARRTSRTPRFRITAATPGRCRNAIRGRRRRVSPTRVYRRVSPPRTKVVVRGLGCARLPRARNRAVTGSPEPRVVTPCTRGGRRPPFE